MELDSTFYDAWMGLGAYHYYRTQKAKDFLWLPFVSDQREQGIAEIKKAIANGFLATYNARESLMRIYFEEGRYEDAASLADSLNRHIPNDPYCLLYFSRSLAELGRLDEAEIKLRELKVAWKESPYYDPIGLYEAELVTARIFFMDGDSELARRIVDKILSEKELADNNAYFSETFNKAREFSKQFR